MQLPQLQLVLVNKTLSIWVDSEKKEYTNENDKHNDWLTERNEQEPWDKRIEHRIQG